MNTRNTTGRKTAKGMGIMAMETKAILNGEDNS